MRGTSEGSPNWCLNTTEPEVEELAAKVGHSQVILFGVEHGLRQVNKAIVALCTYFDLS